jgi:Fur family transcriptional regulator, peroxide stress response regulator
MQFTDKRLKQELINVGIRPSYHRLCVLEYLQQNINHPTVEEIFASLSQQIPTLSRMTIYNTLHRFAEAGLINVISIDGIEQRYDIQLHPHGHFKCDNCGKITNFAINIDALVTGDLQQFQIKSRNVYFNGLCPVCLNHKKEEA